MRFAAGVALAILTVPLFASAQSVCPTLSLGSTGPAVIALQDFFVTAYSNFPQTYVTGYFGTITQSAVQEWQRDHDIASFGSPATTGYGSVGPRTAAAMKLSCVAPASSATASATSTPSVSVSIIRTLSEGMSGSDILALQQFLITQGILSSGSATGYFGVLTQAAVERFQVENDIVSSGTPITTGYGAVGPKTRALIATFSESSNGKNTTNVTTVISSQPQNPTSSTVPSGGGGGGGGGNTNPPVQNAASCSFNGETILSGSTVTAYQSSSVPSGQTCILQQRVCTNGTLSGSYTNASCNIGTPSPVPPPQPSSCEARKLQGTFSSDLTYDPASGGILPSLQLPDLNGDRKADLVFRREDNVFMVALGNGGSYPSLSQWTSQSGPFLLGQDLYADVNGDGKDDLIFITQSGQVYVSLSTGTGFAPATLWANLGAPFVLGSVQLADLTGNCMADLIYQDPNNHFIVYLSNGSSFGSPQTWVTEAGSFAFGQAQYADVTGDHKADLIYQTSTSTFMVGISTGTSFLPLVSWGGFDQSFQVGEAMYGDVTGDGKFDLIYHSLDQNIFLAPSTGSSFMITGVPVLQIPDPFWIGQLQVADLNGDGKADLLYIPYNYDLQAAYSNGSGFSSWTEVGNIFRSIIAPLPARGGVSHVQYYGYYTDNPVLDSMQLRDHANVTFINESDWKTIPTIMLSGMKYILSPNSADADLINLSFNGTVPVWGSTILRSDWQSRWQSLAVEIAPYQDGMAAIYVGDELIWSYAYGGNDQIPTPGAVSSAVSALSQMSSAMKSSFPNTPVLLVEACPIAQSTASLIPSTIDWLGYDCYGQSASNYASMYAQIEPQLKSNQLIVYVPQAAYMGTTLPTVTDQNNIIQTAQAYRDAAISDPSVVAFLPYQSRNNFTGPLDGFGQLGAMENSWGALDNSVVQNAFRAIGNSLLNSNVPFSPRPAPDPNAALRQNLITLQSELEAYKSAHGSYPTTNGNWVCSGPSGCPLGIPNWTSALSVLNAPLPQDISSAQCGWDVNETQSYSYISPTGTWYKLTVCAESPVPPSDPDYDVTRALNGTSIDLAVCGGVLPSGQNCGTVAYDSSNSAFSQIASVLEAVREVLTMFKNL